MTNASDPPGAPAAVTIDPREAAHFGAMAADWWNPKGSSAMLQRLNPVRLRFVREAIERHWGLEETVLRPLAGRRAIDVGCGAGLLAEPLARLGAAVVGIDAAAETVAAARAHATGQGLAIDYRQAGVEDLGADERFDLVVAMEVIEHVADPAGFVRGLARALAPGGLLVMSTPNRTALSRLAVITIGETLGGIPRGTHNWERFITPDELTAHLAREGLRVTDTRGLSFSPARGFALSDDLRIDYLVSAAA